MPAEPLEPLEIVDSDDLRAALRATADAFAPDDPLTLQSAGHLKGRRMRRRRTVGAVAGATALATVAVAGVTASTWLDGDAAPRQSGVAAPASPHATGVPNPLKAILPPGVRAEPYTLPALQPPGMNVLTLRSKGSKIKHLLSAGFGTSTSGTYQYACQSKGSTKWHKCKLSSDSKGRLPHTWNDNGHARPVVGTQTKVKGGTVTVYRMAAEPGGHQVTVLAVFVGHGYEADVAESPLWNDDEPHDTPFVNKLTDAQLVSIVSDKAWKRDLEDLMRLFEPGGIRGNAADPKRAVGPGAAAVPS